MTRAHIAIVGHAITVGIQSVVASRAQIAGIGNTVAANEGRVGPHIFIRGNKADTAHWMPLHPAAVKALKTLRGEPVIDKKVFRVRGSKNPASRVSHLFAALCVEAGATKTVERNGENVVQNRMVAARS